MVVRGAEREKAKGEENVDSLTNRWDWIDPHSRSVLTSMSSGICRIVQTRNRTPSILLRLVRVSLDKTKQRRLTTVWTPCASSTTLSDLANEHTGVGVPEERRLAEGREGI